MGRACPLQASMISHRSVERYWDLPRNSLRKATVASPINSKSSLEERKNATVWLPRLVRKVILPSILRASFFSGTAAASSNICRAPSGSPLLSKLMLLLEQSFHSFLRKVRRPESQSPRFSALKVI
jgi:hypothetical protein